MMHGAMERVLFSLYCLPNTNTMADMTGQLHRETYWGHRECPKSEGNVHIAFGWEFSSIGSWF